MRDTKNILITLTLIVLCLLLLPAAAGARTCTFVSDIRYANVPSSSG